MPSFALFVLVFYCSLSAVFCDKVLVYRDEKGASDLSSNRTRKVTLSYKVSEMLFRDCMMAKKGTE